MTGGTGGAGAGDVGAGTGGVVDRDVSVASDVAFDVESGHPDASADDQVGSDRYVDETGAADSDGRPCPLGRASPQLDARVDSGVSSDASDVDDEDGSADVRTDAHRVPPNMIECAVYHNDSTIYSIDAVTVGGTSYFSIGGSSLDSLVKVMNFDFSKMKWKLYKEIDGAGAGITSPVRIEDVLGFQRYPYQDTILTFIARSTAGIVDAGGLFASYFDSSTAGKFDNALPFEFVSLNSVSVNSVDDDRQLPSFVASHAANSGHTAAVWWRWQPALPNPYWVLVTSFAGELVLPPSPGNSDVLYGRPILVCNVFLMNSMKGLSWSVDPSTPEIISTPPNVTIENLAKANLGGGCGAFVTGTRADGSQALYKWHLGANDAGMAVGDPALTEVRASLQPVTHVSVGRINGVQPVMLTSGYGKSNGLEIHYPDGPDPTSFTRAGDTLFLRDKCTAEYRATFVDIPGYSWSFLTVLQSESGAMSDVALCLAGEGDPSRTQFQVHLSEP